MRPLSGRKALVTGGTRGIGEGIARRLLADGAEVAVTGTRPDGKGPEGTSYFAVDFNDMAATQAFAAQVAAMGFDVLVNNAGTNKNCPFAEIELADFEMLQRINVTAPMLLARAVVPGMCARKWGRILNIGSIWSIISKAQRGSYTASKFALDGLTAALAAEVAVDNVLVNTIAPGFIDTELSQRMLGEEGMRQLTASVPMKRAGTVEEVAAFVAWMAGPENTFISGQCIAIDGGFTRV